MAYIPKGFCLSRYEEILPLSNNWASNFDNRWGLILSLKSGRNREVINLLNSYFQQPSSTTPVDTNQAPELDDWDWPSWSRILGPVKVENAYYLARELASTINLKNYAGYNYGLHPLSIAPLFKVSRNKGHLLEYVDIDLNAPDELLHDALDAYLSYAREQLGKKKAIKRYKAGDFESWITHKVLPYIDLIIWNRAHDREVPNSIAAGFLFDENNLRRIDKTRKIAKEFFGENLDHRTDQLEGLVSQAVQEYEENIQVIKLYEQGVSIKAIAEKLHITQKTVEMHLKYRF